MAMTDRAEHSPGSPGHRTYPSVLYAFGFIGVYMGQRILDVGRASTVVTFLGVLLLTGVVGFKE